MLSYPGNTTNHPEAIKLIRTRLTSLGYTDTDIVIAIKRFQKDKQLVQDGIVGPLTWTRLFADKIEVVPKSLLINIRALEVAKTQLFVREKTGHNDGQEVETYLRSVHLGRGYSWCAAFVYWCYQQAAVALNRTNPLPDTAGVLNHWNITHGKKITHDSINAGDIFIMDFGKGLGHTGIVSQIRGLRVETVEGNTSADPSYAGEDREGNGVFERSRKITSIHGFIRYQ